MEDWLNSDVLTQLALALFVAIVFLQSGIDKVVDRKGNLEWLNGHFSKTFMSSMVPLMLTIVTLFELAAGALAVCGIFCAVMSEDPSCIRYSLILAMFTLLMLLFGQRVAKDYEGAKTIVIYLILCLIGVIYI